MFTVIANTLLLGVGIALNPVAAVASILILRDARSRYASVAFVLGWILGMVVLVALSTWLAIDQIGRNRRAVLAYLPLVWVGVGALLIVLALRGLLRPRSESADGGQPRWMQWLEQDHPAKVLGIGLVLSTFSLRNLALLAAAVSIVTQADLGPVSMAISAGVFVTVSSLGVLAPPLVRLFGGQQADAVLAALAAWLILNMSRITSAFLLLIGAYVLMRGVLNLR